MLQGISSTLVALAMATAGQSAPEAPVKLVLQGKVRTVKGGPIKTEAQLVEDRTNDTYVLRAADPELDAELRRLSGIHVKLHCKAGLLSGNRREVVVERYEILDVGNGVKPRIGMLATMTLAGEERLIFVDKTSSADLLPRGWGRKMKRHVGATLWMVGSGSGETFKPIRFSILRPKAERNAR